MWIRFTADAEKRGACPEETERFSCGQVADLREDQARRWLRRNLAVECDPPALPGPLDAGGPLGPPDDTQGAQDAPPPETQDEPAVRPANVGRRRRNRG